MRYFTLIFLFILSAAVFAGEFPIAGGYGFDWAKPTTARCKRITQADSEKFKKCEFSDAENGAFGLPLANHTCRVSSRSEYMIYSSRANCVTALETMQSHAP